MFKRSTSSWLAGAIASIAAAILPLSASAQVIPGTTIPQSVTHLVISNATSQAVTIGITCPSGANIEDGCTTTVANLSMINVTSGYSGSPIPVTVYGSTPVKGIFTIAARLAYELVNTLQNSFAGNQEQNCLQGLIVSFNQLPTCPGTPPAFPQPGDAGPAIPNGVSAAEPTLNLPHTIGGAPGGGANEACDVTCVNGANAIIQLTLTSPSSGALPWTYDAAGSIGPGQSFATVNSWVNVAGGCDNNCVPERPGVYPYGCTLCNEFPDPAPPCGQQFCATANGLPPNTGCNFQRSPNTANPVTSQFGGSIVYTYVGPAIPPPTCRGVPGFFGGGGNKKTRYTPIKHQLIGTKHDPFKIPHNAMPKHGLDGTKHDLTRIRHAVIVDGKQRVISY